jgi:adenylate kinase family enzyme
MRKRFKVYFSETEPIIELYRGRNNVIEIDSLKSAK